MARLRAWCASPLFNPTRARRRGNHLLRRKVSTAEASPPATGSTTPSPVVAAIRIPGGSPSPSASLLARLCPRFVVGVHPRPLEQAGLGVVVAVERAHPTASAGAARLRLAPAARPRPARRGGGGGAPAGGPADLLLPAGGPRRWSPSCAGKWDPRRRRGHPRARGGRAARGGPGGWRCSSPDGGTGLSWRGRCGAKTAAGEAALPQERDVHPPRVRAAGASAAGRGWDRPAPA